MIVPTAKTIELIDVRDQSPPRADKLILLSMYGVTSIGTYQPGFHVAWAPMPKAPESVKRRILEPTGHVD